MEQEFKVFPEYIAILKRYKYYVFFIATVVLILSSVIAMKLPYMYKSTATILINQAGMPEDIVKSMVTNYAEQRIQIINKKIMSSENLKSIVEKFNLYQEERKKSGIQSIINKMRENTHMEMVAGKPISDSQGRLVQTTIGFTLSFDSESPEISQQITEELVTLHLNANVEQRAKVTENATEFLKQEMDRLRNEISMLETKLAKFKEINAKNLPDQNKINFSRMDRIQEQLLTLNSKIRSLTERIFNLKSQLAQVDPYTTSYSSKGDRVYGIDDRLVALKSEYAALSSKYSKGHPDLVKINREIVSLEKETGTSFDKGDYYTILDEKRAQLTLLLDRYSPGHPDVKKLKQEISNLKKVAEESGDINRKTIRERPNNPAFIQLQTELMATQSELNSLQISRKELDGKILYYEEIMAKSPEIEREYNTLMRDYENATVKYREIKSKHMEATMSESMENITKGNEFVVLEPPLLPHSPFKPNRQAIMFLGLLASIATAFGFVVVKESLNPSIYTAGRLASVIGMQPLVIIPYMESEKILLKRKQTIKIISFTTIILLVFVMLRYVMLFDE